MTEQIEESTEKEEESQQKSSFEKHMDCGKRTTFEKKGVGNLNFKFSMGGNINFTLIGGGVIAYFLFEIIQRYFS